MEILFVNGCIRGESSRTLALARCFRDADLIVLAAEGLDILGADVDGIRSAAKENTICLARAM